MTDTELLDWLATHPTHVLIHDTVKGWEYSARDGNRWQHGYKDFRDAITAAWGNMERHALTARAAALPSDYDRTQPIPLDAAVSDAFGDMDGLNVLQPGAPIPLFSTLPPNGNRR